MNCHTTKLESERGALDFESVAIDVFSFLETDNGFRCIHRSPTHVRFESDTVFVNVYHGRSSYELGVEVGRLADGEDSRFRLPTIVAALGDGEKEPKSFFQASEREAVRSCLAQLGGLVKSYCTDLLRGDEEAFRRVQRVAERIGDELTEHYAHAPLRRKAEAFWAEKKYVDALLIYEQFSDSLTPIERKRVAFAKRHSG